MYKVTIEEFDSTSWLYCFEDKVFLKTNNYIYEQLGGSWQPVYCIFYESEDKYISSFANSFWLLKKEKNNVALHCIDSNKEKYKKLKGSFQSNSILFNKNLKNYIGIWQSNGDRGLAVGSLYEETPSYFIEGRFFNGVKQYESNFIVRGIGDNNALICLDSSLNEVWRTPLKYDDGAMRGLPCNPEIYNNVIYVNMPDWPRYQKKPTPMDIGAFSADTGEALWSDTLPCCARNADLHGSEVYIASDYFIQIRDVTNGEVVWEMEPFWQEDEVPCHLYPLDKQDLLVNFQFKNKALIINRNDKTIKQLITLPEKSNYCFSTTRLPIKLSETRWAWSLGFTDFKQGTRNSGVVFIDLDNDQPNEVEAVIKPRPEHQLKGKTVESGEKEYFLSMKHNDLDEVIRYCIIIIKNLAHDKGRIGLPNKPDRKHNGKVHVTIDKSALVTDKTDDEINESLYAIKAITEHALKKLNITAGNKKDDFIVDIKLV